MKIAAIIGGAASVWKDWQDLQAISEVDAIIAVNHVGMRFYGEINHWVSLHSEFMPDWLAARAARGLNTPEGIWFPEDGLNPNIPHRTVKDWGGSSGLMAVTVALELGFDKIILCGVPIEDSAAHFLYQEDWQGAKRYQQAWQRHVAELAGKVRSMDGWTSQFLGRPDAFWLQQQENASGAQSNS